MVPFSPALAILVLVGMLLGLVAAGAQVNSIFGPGPRPPADVPSRPSRAGPTNLPPAQQDSVRDRPPAAAPSAPLGVKSAPLPPPAGAESVDAQPGAQTRPSGPPQPGNGLGTGPAALPGLPPGQRQPRGSPQPASTAPQASDEVVTELPAQKIANPGAVFSGLDKITGRIISFDVALNETVQFGALQVTPRVCYTRPPTETPRTDGFVEVEEITLQGEVRRIFTGWMFAASPGLHAVEHPIYDVWLTDCKGPAPVPGTTPSASAAPSGGGATTAAVNPLTAAAPADSSGPAPTVARSAKPRR